MMTKEFIGEAQLFLNKLFSELDKIKLDLSNNELDHICYRVKTTQEYLELKEQLLLEGKLISDKKINGREICVFELDKPFRFQERAIYLLELPAPKKGSEYKSGFEHVEFVLTEDLRTFMSSRPDLNFNIKGLEKKVNPEIRLNFSFGSIKFHNHNLSYVIRFLD